MTTETPQQAANRLAAGALVALGAIIGARCAIKPKARDSWLIVPNLWGGIVGLPSAKKSPAIGAALKPLDRLIARAMEAAYALANDGILQRFQVLVYHDHRAWEWRDRAPAKDARDRAFVVFEALADFAPAVLGAAPAADFDKFLHFRLDDAAQDIFIKWSGDLHGAKMPAEDHPVIAQHLAKFDKLFPVLALILHLVDCAATGQRGPVTTESAVRAAAWCKYLEAHARRYYGLLTDDSCELRAPHAALRCSLPREHGDREAGCSNSTDLVAGLRRRGLDFPCDRIPDHDSDGKPIRRGVYHLTAFDRREVIRAMTRMASNG